MPYNQELMSEFKKQSILTQCEFPCLDAKSEIREPFSNCGDAVVEIRLRMPHNGPELVSHTQLNLYSIMQGNYPADRMMEDVFNKMRRDLHLCVREAGLKEFKETQRRKVDEITAKIGTLQGERREVQDNIKYVTGCMKGG